MLVTGNPYGEDAQLFELAHRRDATEFESGVAGEVFDTGWESGEQVDKGQQRISSRAATVARAMRPLFILRGIDAG